LKVWDFDDIETTSKICKFHIRMATIQHTKKVYYNIATIKIFDIKQHQGNKSNLKVTVNLFESQQQHHKKGDHV
jgi:hypothetical protein